MEKISIHKEIYKKLDHFIEIKKIPNILFHGKYGCGKKTIVNDFIDKIYNNKYTKDLVMFVNCSHGKGIKFIRDELKFFAKTNVQNNEGNVNFKTIVLSNVDKLTMDAQSALRRCIELFSYNTRFFVVAEDKYKLMKPILSRFCELYVPEPIYQGKIINLNSYLLEKTYKTKSYKTSRMTWLKKELQKLFDISSEKMTLPLIAEKSVLFYEKGYNSIEMMDVIKNMQIDNNIIEIYLCHNKMRKEIRNEKILMLMIMNCIYLQDKDIDICDLSFL
jgi:DNA polymerase III delta prime subunit